MTITFVGGYVDNGIRSGHFELGKNVVDNVSVRRQCCTMNFKHFEQRTRLFKFKKKKKNDYSQVTADTSRVVNERLWVRRLRKNGECEYRGGTDIGGTETTVSVQANSMTAVVGDRSVQWRRCGGVTAASVAS